ncbi:MAG: hypothetical protein HOJ38_07355 [Rhodobiaceae bacterium]|jgi:uncharacterized protein YjiS (DUF1127 family)|nr:hypothetical protein [Rhodobiaceae bacterium]MBT5641396.1 hypothetical protein [Rhodobiaceae bacterium]MBT6222847.1 hypothetical protein [Rhodobiaceae bacterium]|tara:strand:- start:149 stop:307 length:159 start_codon:yes stop_codon:yes gene_type:complete
MKFSRNFINELFYSYIGYRKNLKAETELKKLSNLMLSDIGIEKQDIHSAIWK